MIDKLKGYINSKYLSWLDRRLKATDSIVLTQKRIFIFPGRIGLFYILLVVLLFVTAVNYQNNLLFSFSCLLVAIFVSAIAYTYQNLSGLKITAGKCNSVFEGELANFEVKLSSNKGAAKEGVVLGFSRDSDFQVDQISSEIVSKLSFKTGKRGLVSVPRFTLFSHYPLGLIRCWTWVTLDYDAVVYPKPTFIPFKKSVAFEGDDLDDEEVDTLIKGQSADDFYGFKSYQKGDSLKHIAWRQYAKTSQLLTKEFSSFEGVSRWLDWHSLAGSSDEARLRILCGWVLTADSSSDEYGLILPGEIIELNSGEVHKHQCLRALALYGVELPSRMKTVQV